jgi:hypothetical protein
MGALVVAIDDEQRSSGAPHVVVGRERRKRRAAEIAHASASKMRFAPGSSPIDAAS